MAEEQTPPAEGQGGEGQTPAPAGWMDGLPEDARGYVENKGWKEPTDVLASYQNLEKLRGVPEDRLLRLPDDPSAEGAMDDVYNKLGRPETPDKYTRALSEGFNDDVFKDIAAEAHKMGVTDSQFQALQKKMEGLGTSVLEQQQNEIADRFDTWKGKNPDGFNDAARLMANVGVNEEQLAGILEGDKAAMYDFLAKVASRSGDSKVVQGDPSHSDFSMTPQVARQKINEKMSDKAFMERYSSSNQKVREVAIAEMSRLHEIAAKEAGK